MKAKSIEQEVIIGPDNYVGLVSEAKKNQVLVSLISQIQSARLNDEKKPEKKREGLVDKGFFGGDGCGYGLKGNDVLLYLTDAANNPGLENYEIFSRQLTGSDGVFFLYPKKSSTLEAKANDPNDNSVAAFNLSELERQGVLKKQKYSDELLYVEVSTGILAKGERVFRKEYGNEVTDLFDRVHGEAIYGNRSIGAKLKQKGTDTARIYVLNPSYVRDKLAQKKVITTLWRASFVSDFGSHSFVDLGDRGLDRLGYLWGVVRKPV